MTSLIKRFLAEPMSGESIEIASLNAIDRESPTHSFSVFEWTIIKRMIHASADFGIMSDIRFQCEAIKSGIAALQAGATIYADANMIRSGLSIERLQRVNSTYDKKHIHCHVADIEITNESKRTGLPRSLFALRKARPWLHGGIVAIGNAPIALLELNRMIIEENIRPALILGFPVGFVHVEESKNELLSLEVPAIVLQGRRGGSPLAVAAIHALAAISKDLT